MYCFIVCLAVFTVAVCPILKRSYAEIADANWSPVAVGLHVTFSNVGSDAPHRQHTNNTCLVGLGKRLHRLYQ